MAIFGTLEVVKSQADNQKFRVAFDYLDKIMRMDSTEHKRLMSYPLNTFEKIQLDENNFALEQVYMTKERHCFFLNLIKNTLMFKWLRRERDRSEFCVNRVK
ncbi:MAG: hypothetical protein EOM05_09375 [Clostridia bacterium]|nr:hypothetical protein [Clostridia bacterium]